MALTIITPGTTPFGSWADDAPIPPVGNSDAKVIARWRALPFQTLRKVSPVGIETRILLALNAYHINGIDHVEFAVQGGEYTAVDRPIQARFDPMASDFPLAAAPGFGKLWHGSCYVAILRGQDFSGASGQVEVRAKVFTNDGHGRILQDSDGQDLGDKSLILWIDTNDGLTKFPIAYIQPGWMGDSELNNPDKPFANLSDGIAEAANSMPDNFQGGWTAALRNADYDLVRTGQPNPFDAIKRWGIIRADLSHGATKAGVRITESSGVGLNLGLLRLKDLSLRKSITSDASSPGGAAPAVWFDSIHAETNPNKDDLDNNFGQGLVRLPNTQFQGGQFITDTTATVVGRFAKNATLVDRCTVTRTGNDALRQVRAAYDSDFSELGYYAHLFQNVPHVDGVQWFDPNGIDFENVIYDSLRFYDDNFTPGRLQPFFFRTGEPDPTPGRIRNMAIVNCVAVPADDENPTDSRSRLTLEHFLLIQTSQAHSDWVFSDDEDRNQVPPGPPINRTLKDILILGCALHQVLIPDIADADRTNLIFDRNRFEDGVDWNQYGNNLVLPAPGFEWSLPLLIPTTGGNLANIVPIWTAPADVVGADRPFTGGSLFKSYVGAYEP